MGVDPEKRRRNGTPERLRRSLITLSILMKPLMKLLSDVPNSRLITVSTIADKLRVNGSLARVAIRDLEAKGKIRRVSTHNSQLLYTSLPNPRKKQAKEAEAEA